MKKTKAFLVGMGFGIAHGAWNAGATVWSKETSNNYHRQFHVKTSEEEREDEMVMAAIGIASLSIANLLINKPLLQTVTKQENYHGIIINHTTLKLNDNIKAFSLGDAVGMIITESVRAATMDDWRPSVGTFVSLLTKAGVALTIKIFDSIID